jgi:hypothetical protein
MMTKGKEDLNRLLDILLGYEDELEMVKRSLAALEVVVAKVR